MAADSPYTVEAVAGESVGEAYVSPTADFLIISVFVSVLAVAGVAVMLP